MCVRVHVRGRDCALADECVSGVIVCVCGGGGVGGGGG